MISPSLPWLKYTKQFNNGGTVAEAVEFKALWALKVTGLIANSNWRMHSAHIDGCDGEVIALSGEDR
jgi:hypothetical protein